MAVDIAPRIPTSKLVVLCGLAICAVISYAATVLVLDKRGWVSERSFGEDRRDDTPQLRPYIEIVAVDAINDSLRLRVSFSTSPPLRGNRAGTANQDLKVLLGDRDNQQDLAFRSQDIMAAATLDVNLDGGSVSAFPLDHYVADLRIAASDAGGTALPVQATLWEGIPGWTLSTAQVDSEASGGVNLRFELRRSLPSRLLVLAIYAEMVLIGTAALTMGCRVFLGLRPPETTLTGALTGMIFSLPALRYALPGSVPLGVVADLLVFFWAELAVALGFVLFVVTWAQVRVKT